jgi:hypothetical protein
LIFRKEKCRGGEAAVKKAAAAVENKSTVTLFSRPPFLPLPLFPAAFRQRKCLNIT